MKAGVNVYGYVYAESGVGEHTRLLIEALRQGGVEYSVVPFEETISRQQAEFCDLGHPEPIFDINIIGVNADSVPLFAERFGFSTLENRYNIGLWAWELEDFPNWMADSADLIDEVWANSSFSARSIAKKILKPVQPFPLPIQTPNPPSRSRRDLDLPEGFLYLFCFDLDSIFARKNPLATIEAFKRTFPKISETRLVIKSVNAERHPEKAALIEDAVAGREDIIYRDGYLPAGDHHALMAACNCYVSLHRSEGFGLTMAEAMALGKPVIATGYSGNMDFMNDHNSFLVPFGYTKIGPGCEPYPADAVWAEPDIEVAARAMRRVIEDSEEARMRGQRAIEDIESFHSPAVRSRFIVDRISRIREKLGQGVTQRAAVAPSPAPIAPNGDSPGFDCKGLESRMCDLAGLINLGPHLDAPTVLPFGRLLRRVMFRLNTNLFLYQQEVDRALLSLVDVLCIQLRNTTILGRQDADTPKDLSGHCLSTAALVEEAASEVEGRFGKEGAEISRNLRLLAARMKGFVR